MFDFEKLNVYLKTEELYILLTKQIFFLSFDLNLKNQIRRASSSTLLNIAEGTGKVSRKEKNYFYRIARGSIFECVAIIRILRIEGIINDKVYLDIYLLLKEIGKMIYGLIRNNNIASQ